MKNPLLMGIKKEHRLKKNTEIRQVLYKGKKIKNKYYTIIYMDKKLAIPRIGIFIKRTKLAVRRNKEKRHIREIMRFFLHNIKPYDIIIIQHKPAFLLDFHTKKKRIQELLEYAGLFKKNSVEITKTLSIYLFAILSFFL